MAIDENVGVQMPGSTDEQFAYGVDYSGLFPVNAAIPGMPPQLLPDSQNMGAESMPVGLMTDIDAQFDGGDLFDNPVPGYDIASQFDSMAQLPTDVREASLYNQDMWKLQESQPLDVSLVDPLDLQIQTEGN